MSKYKKLMEDERKKSMVTYLFQIVIEPVEEKRKKKEAKHQDEIRKEKEYLYVKKE